MNLKLRCLISCIILSTGCTTIGQQIINRDGTIQLKQENVNIGAQNQPSTPIYQKAEIYGYCIELAYEDEELYAVYMYDSDGGIILRNFIKVPITQTP
jgi:hypothetical protein